MSTQNCDWKVQFVEGVLTNGNTCTKGVATHVLVECINSDSGVTTAITYPTHLHVQLLANTIALIY